MLPVAASKAYIRPFTPLLSPPALPMNTNPFQAIGAAGTDSPLAGSAMLVDQSGLPFLAV